MFPMAGKYGAPVALGAAMLPSAQVLASVSDHGTIRLEQDGRSVLLTPAEVRALAALVETA